MVTKKKLAAATFGAAMTSLFVAPQLDADIIDLTFTPGSVAYGSLAGNVIDQLGAGFSQWNDSVGQTIYAGSLSSIALVQYSQSLSAGTFAGTGGIGIAPNAGAASTQYIGFRFGGNVGWFSFSQPGGGGTALVYGGGQYGSMGETVHVGGGGVIPEPTGFGALAVLAVGALGVRRNRKK